MTSSPGVLGDKVFTEQVEEFRQYLSRLKVEFDGYDRDLKEEAARLQLLESRKPEVFRALDVHFAQLWDLFKRANGDPVGWHKLYAEKVLLPYLYKGVEINEYIRTKPLGYAGDYVTMNYIYDHHRDHYLGRTLFTKLINNYTCNTTVASSNIFRKDFLKKKIRDLVAGKPGQTILSVGCGPAREVVELLKEGALQGPLTIHLLDLEKNAINYVKKELAALSYDRKQIKISLHLLDLIEIVKNKKIKELFKSVDLVYVSGVFDYLSERTSRRILKSLFEITSKELIVFNMSLENAEHRIYYEVLGEWVMYHRKREDLLKWGEGLGDEAAISIIDYPQCKCYWILRACRVNAH
jgi:hypothetical protein